MSSAPDSSSAPPPAWRSPAPAIVAARQRVLGAIAKAAKKSGRRAEDVVLVAVTKSATDQQVCDLVAAGHQDFAENRVQLLLPRVELVNAFVKSNPKNKAAMAPGGPRWHMIGHLQRNKVKQVVPAVTLIHSIDTLRLAEEIHGLGQKLDKVIDVLIQVNASEEPNKFGVAAPAVVHLAEQLDTMTFLRVRGLMTMAAIADDAEAARPAFARTADLFHEVRSRKIGGDQFNLLSMGMSGDFEVAIEEGANIVRVGRALFESDETPQA